MSNNQYTLECNRQLEFNKGTKVVSHNYTIKQDNECELRENPTHFILRLSLSLTMGINIDPQFSTARIIIDDSNETECCEFMCNLLL